MLRTAKPKNARSKRALAAREPKLVEGPKSALFIRGSTTGEIVNKALGELLALKKPDGVPYSKKNDIHPFLDNTSLEFFAQKKDASIFIIGSSNKKRPNNLVWARSFDFQILDMLETGIEKFESMSTFPVGSSILRASTLILTSQKLLKGTKPTLGSKPMFYFSGEQFDSHPLYMQFKSIIVDTFHGQCITSIPLAGLEHVIACTSPPIDLTASSETESLPLIYFRVYALDLQKSGERVPRVELRETGPSFDFKLRRSQEADVAQMKNALRRPKDITKGTGKKVKNISVDDMGDKVGRIHVGKQDLSQLQTRKMKGLDTRRDVASDAESGGDSNGGDDGDDNDDDDVDM